MFPKTTICSFSMLISLGVFILAAWKMMNGVEPFYTWFYTFAWWSYIVFVQAFLFHRGGEACFFSSPRDFLLLLPLSTTLWLTFEAFNFRLQNWHYINLPPERLLRWLGYTLSFATVLPAIFCTKSLLDHLGFFSLAPGNRPFVISKRLHKGLVCGGVLCLLLPLIWPRYFFPLMWLGFIPLLEPVNYASRGFSLLRDWEEGSFRNLYLLLLSGLICGFLWEFWNFWSGAKWFYTVPFVGTLKVFEMPLMGFLGFPPFAVECYVVVNGFRLFGTWWKSRLRSHHHGGVWFLLIVALVLFHVIVFTGIDRFTVVSFSK